MRILQLAQFLPPVAGGEERHVWNLARALAARGHEVTLLGLAAGAQGPGETTADGVRLIRVRSSAFRLASLYSDTSRPHSLPIPDPAVSRVIGRLLASTRFDVVHAHNWIVNSALRPASRAGVPVVMTLHDYSHVCATKRFMEHGRTRCAGPSPARCRSCATDHYGPVIGPVTAAANAWSARRRAAGVAAAAAVSSPVAAAADLRAGLCARVIPNFIPDEIVVEDIPRSAPDAPLLFVGDLSRDKGVHVLLEAYEKLDGAPPLVLAGRPVGTPDWALPPGARILGELRHDEVVTLLRSARAVVVPSVWPDPCPTVVLEAMAAGRPVVAAASGGIVDLVLDGRTGLLVPPDDPGALAAALGSIMANPEQARAFGTAGRDRVRSFTVSAVVGRVEQMYSSCVARP